MNCLEKLQWFCYVCGKFTIKQSRVCIGGIIEKAYEEYFNEHYIANVSWVPKTMCKTCYDYLLNWWNGKRDHMPFGVPMIWSDSGTHNPSNCYVCANYTSGMNRRKKRQIIYTAVRSAQIPLPHSDAAPVPKRPRIENDMETISTTSSAPTHFDSTYEPCEATKTIVPISQEMLDSMVAKLELSQKKAEQLACMLKVGNNLAEGVKVTGYRNRQACLQTFLSLIRTTHLHIVIILPD